MTNQLNKFEKNQIRQAARRCFGLSEAIESDDILTHNEAVVELARQSGLRYQYVLDHISEVKDLLSTRASA